MPKGKYLSQEEKYTILAYRKKNMSIKQISKDIGRSRCVVRNFLQDPENYGKNYPKTIKQKLTTRDKRKIVNTASNSTKSLRQIKAELDLNVSRETIRQVLVKNPNICRQKMMRVPCLKPEHKVARLEFAKANMNRDWNSVISLKFKRFMMVVICVHYLILNLIHTFFLFT